MDGSTVHFTGSRADLLAMLRSLPALLSGRVADPTGIIEGLLLRLGTVLLSKIQQDFILKSHGQRGEDGIQWAPLKRETIAQRRTTKAELRQLGIRGKRVRGFLTPKEDERWREIYATRLARGYEPSHAAAVAWVILKSEGAKTKLDLLGGRKVDILRDTGLLLRSFSPGTDGNVCQAGPGTVTVGTNQKPWHHRGIPGKLPSRPFWPLDGNLPDSYWDAMRLELAAGVAEVLTQLAAAGA